MFFRSIFELFPEDLFPEDENRRKKEIERVVKQLNIVKKFNKSIDLRIKILKDAIEKGAETESKYKIKILLKQIESLKKQKASEKIHLNNLNRLKGKDFNVDVNFNNFAKKTYKFSDLSEDIRGKILRDYIDLIAKEIQSDYDKLKIFEVRSKEKFLVILQRLLKRIENEELKFDDDSEDDGYEFNAIQFIVIGSTIQIR